jgi:hypothetical protein
MLDHSTVYSSTDLNGWSRVLDNPRWGPRSCAASVAFGDRLFLMGGVIETGNPRPKCGDVWSTKDGVNWDPVNLQAFTPRASCAAGVLGPRLLLMGGGDDSGMLAETQMSVDGGRTWTRYPAPWPARYMASAVTIGDTLFLLRGQGAPGVDLQDVWATQNGWDWELVDSNAPALRGSRAVGVGAHLVVLGGGTMDGQRRGDVYAFDPWPHGWSTIGHDPVALELMGYPRLLAMNGVAYAVDGAPNIPVAWSADGLIWTQAQTNLPYRQLPATTVHKGKMIVAGGYVRPDHAVWEVWSSPDGGTWTNLSSGLMPVAEQMLVSHNGELLMIAGRNCFDGQCHLTNAVLHSDDGGAGWGGAPFANFSARAGGAAVEFMGQVWVTGGKTDAGPVAEAWVMNDRDYSWSQPQPNVPWGPRYRHLAVVVGDTLYVGLGLGPGDVPLTDLWATENGVDWRPADGPAPGPRLVGNFGAAAFDDALLVIGGNSPTPPPDGAIWRYRP